RALRTHHDADRPSRIRTAHCPGSTGEQHDAGARGGQPWYSHRTQHLHRYSPAGRYIQTHHQRADGVTNHHGVKPQQYQRLNSDLCPSCQPCLFYDGAGLAPYPTRSGGQPPVSPPPCPCALTTAFRHIKLVTKLKQGGAVHSAARHDPAVSHSRGTKPRIFSKYRLKIALREPTVVIGMLAALLF